MSEPSPVSPSAHVIVHPVVSGGAPRPYRRVDIRGAQVGKAYGLADLLEFMRRAGLDDVEVNDEDIIEWRGGGAEVWG